MSTQSTSRSVCSQVMQTVSNYMPKTVGGAVEMGLIATAAACGGVAFGFAGLATFGGLGLAGRMISKWNDPAPLKQEPKKKSSPKPAPATGNGNASSSQKRVRAASNVNPPPVTAGKPLAPEVSDKAPPPPADTTDSLASQRPQSAFVPVAKKTAAPAPQVGVGIGPLHPPGSSNAKPIIQPAAPDSEQIAATASVGARKTPPKRLQLDSSFLSSLQATAGKPAPMGRPRSTTVYEDPRQTTAHPKVSAGKAASIASSALGTDANEPKPLEHLQLSRPKPGARRPKTRAAFGTTPQAPAPKLRAAPTAEDDQIDKKEKAAEPFSLYKGAIVTKEQLTPEIREHRTRHGDIQRRLKTEFDRAQKAMKDEADNANFKSAADPAPFAEAQVGPYEVGVSHNQGLRDTMEDEDLAAEITFRVYGKEYRAQLFGVFDGDGGSAAAKFMKAKLAAKMAEILPRFNPKGLTDEGIWNALKIAMVELNEEYKAAHQEERFYFGIGPSKVADMEGTTATVALILDGQLWVANVGDSRTVLDLEGTSIQLSADAKPNLQPFKQGIENREGISILGRVDGLLATARAIGDGNLGQHVSARPKIVKMALPASGNLILACDGVYDVASTRQVAQLAHYRQRESAGRIAGRIANGALRGGSWDNVTVMVVKLG